MAPIKSRKLAIMGFRSVGKSSLSIQFVEGQFVDSYDPTIENTFSTRIKHKGQEYQIDLVDTAGQDEYSMISQAYTVDVHGYVLVYSVTSQKSFDVVKEIREKLLDMTGSTYLPIILVGNKTDLHMERTISMEQGKSVADSWKAVFVESSAKENKCVRDIFHAIINEIERLQNGTDPRDKEVGTFKIRDDKVIEEILKTALKVGYRLIDTASVYRNEKSIGNHLKTLMKESEISKDEIFITSKLSPKDQGYESAKKSFHQTLNDLACQVLDLYLIHWPGKSKLKPEDKMNREYRKESWRALEELHQEGLVTAIGVSNYTIKHLEDMEKYSTIKPAVNQVEFHPHLYQKELLEYCQNKGIQLQAYSSLGTGELVNDPTINEIAKEYGKSTSQILLKWGLQHGVGVIPKSTNPEHIIENYDIDDFTLTDEDMTKMDEMNFDKHYCWDPTFVE